MTQTPAEGNSSFVLMLRIAFVATPVWIRCPRHEQTETITRQIVLLRFPCVEIVRPKVMNGQMNDWMRKLQALARVSERVKVWVRARDERVSARVRARVSSWTNAYLGCVCACLIYVRGRSSFPFWLYSPPRSTPLLFLRSYELPTGPYARFTRVRTPSPEKFILASQHPAKSARQAEETEGPSGRMEGQVQQV